MSTKTSSRMTVNGVTYLARDNTARAAIAAETAAREAEARALQSDLSSIMNAGNTVLNNWKQGNAYNDGSNGLDFNTVSTRCYAAQTEIKSDMQIINVESGYEFAWFACDYDGTDYTIRANSSAWSTAPYDISYYSASFYIVLVVRKLNDSANITPTEAKEAVTYTTKLVERMVKSAMIGYNPGVTPDAPYNDCDTFPENTIVLAYRNRNVLHLPTQNTSDAGYVIATLCGVSGLITAWQLAVSINSGKMYSRVNTNTYGDWREVGGASGSQNIITVEPTDNLAAALEDAYLAGNTTVIINGGEHNILNEYGITDAASSYASGFDFYGPKVGKNCTIIGINGAKIKAIYGGSVNDVKTKFSIFNVISSCEIKGLDLEVTNVRYCVHDDPNNLYQDNRPGYRVVYEDCVMKHNGSNGSYSAPACIGAGTTQKSEHVINRCNFTCPTTYENAVTYHNNSGNLTAKVTITNCVFSEDNTIRLYALEESGSYVNALICGNYLGKAINIVPSSTDRFDIVSFNNVIAE